jgi:hypothetical protein
MRALDTVLLLLAKMPNTDVDKVRDRCNILLGMAEVQPKVDANLTQDWLLEGIKTHFEHKGLKAQIPPQSVLNGMQTYKTYLSRAPQVRASIEDGAPGLTKIEKILLARVGAQCLDSYLVTWTEVSFNRMLGYVNHMPEAIMRSFPGYLESRMLGFLIVSRRETNHGNAYTKTVGHNAERQDNPPTGRTDPELDERLQTDKPESSRRPRFTD